MKRWLPGAARDLRGVSPDELSDRQSGVLPCGFRRGLVQWLERDAAYVALRIRLDWRKLAALSDLGVQRRGRVCRRYATRGLASVFTPWIRNSSAAFKRGRPV